MPSPSAHRARRPVLDVLLPEGRPLPEQVWQLRHRAVLWLLAGHIAVFTIWESLRGAVASHVLTDLAPIAIALVVAWRLKGRIGQSSVAAVGLMSCSALAVHLAGDAVELHLHYVVMLGVVTLYQRRVPLVVGILSLLAQPAVTALLHPVTTGGARALDAEASSWSLAQGGFVLCAAAVHVVAWRTNDRDTHTDSLTGLANRSSLLEHLEHVLRASGERQAWLILADLDRFRSLNDCQGPLVGDRVLDEVGTRIANAVRTGDVTARLGGDEFAIVVEHATLDEAILVADRVLLSVCEPMNIAGSSLKMTASVGIVSVDRGAGAADLVRDASLAVVVAQRRGGGCLEVYSAGLGQAVREHDLVEVALRRAVVEDQMTVAFQPIVDLRDGTSLGAEALARWTDPDLGGVPPSIFIPIAESAGLIPLLGRRVLRQACRAAADLDRANPGFFVSVNVSARQLVAPGFVDEVTTALADAGCLPTSIMLELTESSLIDEVEVVAVRLQELRSIGVRVALDDFGTGYSGLAYLRHLPVDVVKVDKSFVDAVDDGVEVLRSILALTSALHLDAVAEGIETDAQRMALLALGCRRGQGYLFARPMPLEDLGTFLTTRPARCLDAS